MNVLKYILRALGLLLAGVGLASLILTGNPAMLLDIAFGVAIVELSHRLPIFN